MGGWVGGWVEQAGKRALSPQTELLATTLLPPAHRLPAHPPLPPLTLQALATYYELEYRGLLDDSMPLYSP